MDQDSSRIELVYGCVCEGDIDRLGCGFILLYSIFYILCTMFYSRYSIFYIPYSILYTLSFVFYMTNTGVGKSGCVVEH